MIILLALWAAAAADAGPVAVVDRPVDVAAPDMLLDVAWDEAGLATGRIARITIKAPRPIAALEGTLGKKALITLATSPDGRLWTALAPVDVEAPAVPQALALKATLDDHSDVYWGKPAPIVEAPYDERQLTVAKKFVAPSREQRRRAARESRALDAVLGKVSKERLWRGSFAKPTAGEETSPFGTRRTYNDKRKSRHLGWDLDGKVGAPITASNRGRVVLATPRFYSGGTVVVDHGQGLFTMYFHMSRIDVKKGRMVEKGEGLGLVGATGQVTGPHLHFSVKLGGLYQDGRYLMALDLSGDVLDVTPAEPAPVAPASAVGQPRKPVP